MPAEGDEQSDRVRVAFVRSGGFGGLRLTTELDAAELSADEAAVLARLLADSTLPPGGGAAPPARGADRFRYDLTIRGADGVARTLSLSEVDVTPELRPLVDRLEAHARGRA